MKKKLSKFFKLHWYRLLIFTAFIIASCVFLLIRFRSLAPILGPSEKETLAGSSNLHALYSNPLHLPLHFLQWASSIVATPSVFQARCASMILGVVALLLFLYIIRRWYGPRTTFFGFFIFICSAWFLHVVHFAGTDIEYLTAILALLAIHIGLQNNQRPLMFFCWLIINLLLLSIPGMIWLIILSLYWQRLTLKEAWNYLHPMQKRSTWILFGVLGLGCLFTRLVSEPGLIRIWLGFPQHFGTLYSHIVILGNAAVSINFRGPHDPQLWLGRLPILDVFLSVMLLSGILFYAKHWRAQRGQMLLSYYIVGLILIGLGGAVRLSLIVPLAYIVAVGGIAYLLHLWTQVFPNNPVAKSFGIVVIALSITISSFYNVRQYFVAWPHSDEVISIYRNPSKH